MIFGGLERKVIYVEPQRMVGLTTSWGRSLFDFDHLYRLLLDIVKRMRLILHL